MCNMKSVVKYTLILQVIFQIHLSGQDENNSNDSILPLEVVIDQALKHSPLLCMYESYCAKSKLEMTLQKYAWMKDIAVTADSKYGRYGNLQPMDQLSLGYGAGFVIKVPLTAILGKNERKHIAQVEYDASKYQFESVKEELIKNIIKQYNDVLLLKARLRIKTESTELSRINQEISYKQLQNKEITFNQYAQIQEIYFAEKERLEITKNEYKTAWLILKQITGLSNI